MKKLICLVLLLALIVGICGCGADGKETAPEGTTAGVEATGSQEPVFRVGYARIDITPEKSVPLGGFGNTSSRMSTNILRRLYATCISIRDAEDNTVLLYSIDLQNISGQLNGVITTISQATGIPEDHIILCATHTHAGPDVVSSEPNLIAYMEDVWADLITVAQESLADLKPAEMFIGSIETENLNFIKHYQYIDDDGNVQYFGDNFGTLVLNETTQHTTQIDQTLHVIQFAREGDKDIVMTNWRAHPLLDSGRTLTQVSSDFVGTFREAMELETDCEFAFFQGAAGNNNNKTRLPQESRTTETAEFGTLLADYTIDCLKNNMTQVETGLIQTEQTMLEAEVNHDTDSLYYTAKAVQTVWVSTNDPSQAIAAGAAYGIRSPFHANAIISRYMKPKTLESELNAIAIGDHVAFVSAPNELYDTLSVMIEDGSPYEMTMTMGYSNGYTGYIPSAYGFEYTSYESDVCVFKPGIGETMVDCFLSMLNEMAA